MIDHIADEPSSPLSSEAEARAVAVLRKAAEQRLMPSPSPGEPAEPCAICGEEGHAATDAPMPECAMEREPGHPAAAAQVLVLQAEVLRNREVRAEHNARIDKLEGKLARSSMANVERSMANVERLEAELEGLARARWVQANAAQEAMLLLGAWPTDDIVSAAQRVMVERATVRRWTVIATVVASVTASTALVIEALRWL